MPHIFDRIFVDCFTNFIEKIILQTKRTLNSQEFLTTLPYLKYILDDKNLGFMLNSIYNIGQTALLADLSFPNYTEHNKWDLYNILQLIRSLIPEDELELLDKLNS